MIKEFILKSKHLPPHYYHLLSSNYLEVVKKISKWKCSLTSVFEICPINSSANAYDVLHSISKDIWKSNKLLPKTRIFVWSDVRVLWLVFMFDYTLEIMQVYINQNLMPLQSLLTKLPSARQMQFTLIMKRSINFQSISNLCFFNKIFTPSSVYNCITHNNFHNILRLFDVLLNFLFTKSEMMHVDYL